MKKIFLIALLALSTIAVFGQTKAEINNKVLSVADEFVTRTNGFIDNISDIDGETIVYITTPTFYDFELIRMDTRNLVNAYSNITVRFPWQKHTTYPGLYWTALTFDKTAILVTYQTKDRTLTVLPAVN